MLSDPALVVAILLLVPLMAAIAYTDTRDLRIPNWAVLGVFAAFLATGSWGLPFDLFLLRIAYAAIALVLFIALYWFAQGGIGAGDLKLLAALMPFMIGAVALDFALVFALVSILGTLAFYIARRRLKGRKTGWKAFDSAIYYPAGIYIGIALTVVLMLEAGRRFA